MVIIVLILKSRVGKKLTRCYSSGSEWVDHHIGVERRLTLETYWVNTHFGPPRSMQYDAERKMKVIKVKNTLMEVITISGKLLVTASVIYPHAKIRLNLRRWRDYVGPFKRNHTPRILVRSWWNDFGAQSNLAQWSWMEDSSGFCWRFFSPQECVSFTLRAIEII